VRTGILGGTFDPIHIAHLHAGEVAIEQAGLDRVLFIPAGDPWQKQDRPVTDATHRLEMTRIATAGLGGFEADGREIDRAGPSYTIDTLASFPTDEELFLIVGSDAAIALGSWHRAEDVRARVSLLIAPRPGVAPSQVTAIAPEATVLDMVLLGVSATEIRIRAGAGRPFRFLVSSGVYDYIVAQRLYTDTGIHDRVGAPLDQEGQS
jgi:nicotinate-nucleotide adenylyltransferase